MKYIITALLLTVGLSIQAQQAKRFFKAVENKDMKQISALLESDVELCIRDNTDFVTRDQAVRRIEQFLANNPPKSITPIHSGSNQQNKSSYRVAKMKTTNGTFRVFVYMENGGKIEEIRFDKF